MRSERYVEAIKHITFSEDFNDKTYVYVIENYKKARRKRRINTTRILIVAATICIVAGLAFMFQLMMKAQSNVTTILDEEVLAELEDISDYKIVEIQNEDGKFDVTEQIDSGEMIIIDGNFSKEDGDVLWLSGLVTGEKLDYFDIGYVLDGKYNYLDTVSVDDIDVSVNIPLSSAEEYYVCLSNHGSTQVQFDGNIEYKTNDLVYRDYGDTLRLDVNEHIAEYILIENFQDIVTRYGLVSVYIVNESTGEEVRCDITSSVLKYTATESGEYTVYGFDEEGEKISLVQYAGVEIEIRNSGKGDGALRNL